MPSDEGGSSITRQTAAVEQPVESPADLKVISTTPLFGKSPNRPVPVQKKVAMQPLKPLNIELIGTVAAGGDSAAIVTVEGNSKQQVVFLGEDIQPGVELFFVDAEGIVVIQNGQKKLISLQRKQLEGITIIKDTVASLDRSLKTNRSSAGNKIPLRTTSSSAEPRPTKNQPSISTSKLMTQAKFTPHLSSGKQDGLLISNIVFGSLFQRAGLYNGDIIILVNGQAFNNSQGSRDLLGLLQASRVIDFELRRAGKVKEIQFDLEK